jgi:putative hydrolase of the HAD superfamily
MSRLTGRDVWVFDLDNTLYPADHTIYHEIGERMTAYIARLVGLDHDNALALREKYFNAYGATVVGLTKHHGADAADFLAYVHDVSMDAVAPDPELAHLIDALPGRRIVFTNGGRAYAHAILKRIGIADVFERVIALEDVGFIPKPEREAFTRLIDVCKFAPGHAVMFEDHARNLDTAASLGFATVLVGPGQAGGAIDYATPRLHPFLRALAPPRIDREGAAP